MYWQDERLSYNNTGYTKRLALNAKMVQHMWIPDIYFVNEKSGIKHDLTKENEVVRLWPDGRVFHSMRCAIIFYSVMGVTDFFHYSEQLILFLPVLTEIILSNRLENSI